jgi:hypothetical protein
VADQLAADDPGVLCIGTMADRSETFGAEADQQGRVAKNRIHTRRERGGISCKAAIGAHVVLADV